MLQYKMGMCLSVLFLISFNLIFIAVAEEEPISISLDCFESCKNQELNYSKNILLVLTIRNNLAYWVSIEGGRPGSDFRLDVSNDKLQNNGKDSEIYHNFLGQSFFIRPNDEIKVYTYFNIYNNIPKDNRLGYWAISPNLLIHNLVYYKVPFESKGIAYFISYEYEQHTIKGNDLNFEAKKPEPIGKVQGKSSEIIPRWLWEHPFLTNIIYPIFTNLMTYVIMLFAGVAISYYKFGRRKKQ